MYRYLFLKHFYKKFKSPWIEYVQGIFNMCGLQYVNHNQNFVNIKWLTVIVNQRLKDLFIQMWSNDINCSFRGHVSQILTSNIRFEKYLDILPKKKLHKSSYLKPSSPCRDSSWYSFPLIERLFIMYWRVHRWRVLVYFRMFGRRENKEKLSKYEILEKTECFKALRTYVKFI